SIAAACRIPDVERSLTNACASLAVPAAKTTQPPEGKLITPRRNRCFCGDLLLANRILQHIANVLAVAVESRQSTIFPLPAAFHVDFHPVNALHVKPSLTSPNAHSRLWPEPGHRSAGTVSAVRPR